jgi:hypothetical protein
MKTRTITGVCAGLLLLAGAAAAAEVPPPLHTAAGLYFACTNRDTPAMKGYCVGAITAHRRWFSLVRHNAVPMPDKPAFIEVVNRVCFDGTESIDQLVESFLSWGQMFAYDGKDEREPNFESPVQAVLIAWSFSFPCTSK